jgi:hypothetical protein
MRADGLIVLPSGGNTSKLNSWFPASKTPAREAGAVEDLGQGMKSPTRQKGRDTLSEIIPKHAFGRATAVACAGLKGGNVPYGRAT